MSSIIQATKLTRRELQQFKAGGLIVADNEPGVDELVGEEVKMSVLEVQLRRAERVTPELEQLIRLAGQEETWLAVWQEAQSDREAIDQFLDIIRELAEAPEFADYSATPDMPAHLRAVAHLDV